MTLQKDPVVTIENLRVTFGKTKGSGAAVKDVSISINVFSYSNVSIQ